MAIPTYDAAPVAKTWLLIRGLTFIAMIIIVGLTANFVAEIIGENVDAPSEILGTLVITCIAGLYLLISIPLFFARARLGLLIMAGCDAALLLAFAIVAVVLGKPLSFLNCKLLDDASAAANSVSANTLVQAVQGTLNKDGSTVDFTSWVGVTRANCYETKAIWGLCISLAILFFCSAVILPILWLRVRKLGMVGKSIA